MVMTDPITDFLTRIRSANMVKHEPLEVPTSKIRRDIAEVLRREGFIRDVEYIEDDKQGVAHIFLKFGKNGERVITNLERISKSGLRAYIKAGEAPKVLNGLGIVIISTSEGVVTNKETREKSIGDEVIVYVW